MVAHPEVDRRKFAERLKALRKQHKLTQKELAQFLGLKRGTIAAWEAMHTAPAVSSVYKVASYFGVSTDYLLGLTDGPHDLFDRPMAAHNTAPDEVDAEALGKLIERVVERVLERRLRGNKDGSSI